MSWNYQNSRLKYVQLFLFLLFTTIGNTKKCECPMSQPPAPGIIPLNSFTITNENYPKPGISNDYDYGKPIIIGNIVLLNEEFAVPVSISSINVACPPGYRIPSIVEYQELLNSIEGNLFINIQKPGNFKGTAGVSYISSTKTYAGKIEPNDPESYEFRGITLDNNEKQVFIDSLNTFYNKQIKVKCFLGTVTYKEDITKDFYYGVEKDITIANQNIGGTLTHFGQTTSNTLSSKVQSKTLGCQLLQSWVRNAAGVIMYSCNKVYVDYRMERNEDPVIGGGVPINSISTEFIPRQHLKMFNEHAIAPIAPKSDGGFYLLFADDIDLYLHVVEYVEFGSNFSMKSDNKLTVKGYPFDICALSKGGFTIYLKSATDSNHSFVAFFNKEFIETYQQVIMNNGQNPTSPINQLMFYDSHKEPIPGFNLMTKPMNGRLIEGKGKVGLIFQHQNVFEDALTATGDSIVIIDPEGDTTYSVPWVSSASLEQYMIYDGRYFISASLGNQSPQNIRICVSDMINVNDDYDDVNHQYLNNPGICENISDLNGVPGDGKNNSCGRLGGIVNIKEQYFVVYSRKECKYQTDLEKGKFEFVTFQIKKMKIENIVSKSFNFMPNFERLVNFKIGKYGMKILILLYFKPAPNPPIIPPTTSLPIEPPINEYTLTNEVGYVFIDAQGEIVFPLQISPPSELKTEVLDINFLTNEPIKYLKRGHSIWTSIDKTSHKINIHYFNALQSGTDPNEIPNEEGLEKEEDYVHEIWGKNLIYNSKSIIFLCLILIL